MGSYLYFYASIIEPQKLEIKQEIIYVPHWKKEMNGMKIGIISDLHIGAGYINKIDKLKTIVENINHEKPDIIVILGDFDARAIIHSNIEEKQISKVLKELKAPQGTFAILGNHDYEPEDIVERIVKNAQIPLLQNQSRLIKYKGSNLKIVGFKDLWHYYLEPPEIIGKITSDTPVIVLSHNPDIFPEIPQETALTLSGHNHGGEVTFPKIGSPFVPSKYGQKYRKGHIAEQNKHLFVTSGIGTLSGFRLMNPPEIVVLTVYCQTPEKMITDTAPPKFFDENFVPYYITIKSQVKTVLNKLR